VICFVVEFVVVAAAVAVVAIIREEEEEDVLPIEEDVVDRLFDDDQEREAGRCMTGPSTSYSRTLTSWIGTKFWIRWR